MHRRRPLPWPFGTNSMGEEQTDLDSLTAPIPVIFFSHFRSSSSSVSLSGYIGPYGGMDPSLKSMAWSYAECMGSSREASVVMMGMNSEYSRGTRSMAACSSSSVAAADVRSFPSCVGSNRNCFWFSSVHRRWQSAEVNLMRPLLASGSHLCFASHQRGRIAS